MIGDEICPACHGTGNGKKEFAAIVVMMMEY